MSESSPTAANCPLCGSDNQCAVAAGRPAADCWCRAVTIDSSARQMAADSANERCLCRACGAPASGSPNAR